MEFLIVGREIDIFSFLTFYVQHMQQGFVGVLDAFNLSRLCTQPAGIPPADRANLKELRNGIFGVNPLVG